MASIGMPTLFAACSAVLDAELRPIHYGELTRMALARLQIGSADDFHRLKEDVREKLPIHGRYDIAYIPAPSCVCVKRRWFVTPTGWLFNIDVTAPIRISGSASSGVSATCEAIMRFPHMITKTQARPEKRAMGCARGLIREKHVTEWFRRTYPDQWLPPDNENKWEQPCDHDFKLRLGQQVLRIDVAGRRSDSKYGKPFGGRKPSTDVHILADIDGDDVIMTGVTRELDDDGIMPEESWPITSFLVWVNCSISGFRWQAIKAAAH